MTTQSATELFRMGNLELPASDLPTEPFSLRCDHFPACPGHCYTSTFPTQPTELRPYRCTNPACPGHSRSAGLRCYSQHGVGVSAAFEPSNGEVLFVHMERFTRGGDIVRSAVSNEPNEGEVPGVHLGGGLYAIGGDYDALRQKCQWMGGAKRPWKAGDTIAQRMALMPKEVTGTQAVAVPLEENGQGKWLPSAAVSEMIEQHLNTPPEDFGTVDNQGWAIPFAHEERPRRRRAREFPDATEVPTATDLTSTTETPCELAFDEVEIAEATRLSLEDRQDCGIAYTPAHRERRRVRFQLDVAVEENQRRNRRRDTYRREVEEVELEDVD